MKSAQKSKPSPLSYPAVALSLASLAWTTWSLVDLLGTGLIGVTVAAGADVVWGAVILAEARRLRVSGKAWVVPAVGWAALLAVAGLLVWHGLDRGVAAMAVAGPLLPLGAKVVWVLALADMRDPAALTDDELHQLARMERGMAFEEAKHRIEMRRREMGAELQMTEVSTDFDIELMRQDKSRELHRRRPLELPAAEVSVPVNARLEPVAQWATEPAEPARVSSPSEDASTAGRGTSGREVFGFAAVLPQGEARGEARGEIRGEAKSEISRPARAKTSRPRQAKKDPREAAVAAYLASVETGQPLSGAELGRRYSRTARWGQQLIAEAKND